MLFTNLCSISNVFLIRLQKSLLLHLQYFFPYPLPSMFNFKLQTIIHLPSAMYKLSSKTPACIALITYHKSVKASFVEWYVMFCNGINCIHVSTRQYFNILCKNSQVSIFECYFHWICPVLPLAWWRPTSGDYQAT